jgi:thymidylate synthase (FAD)
MEDTKDTTNNSNVKLVAITPNSEQLISYCARVSNPMNQNSTSISGLINYCIKNGHWSPFEMTNMVIEIETSRAISAQILRHKSFSFQEFSQRYSSVIGYNEYDARAQDLKNRQNSNDILDDKTKKWFKSAQNEIWEVSHKKYNEALEMGIAKECARFILPMNTKTRIYMNGNIRSWIHYLSLRASKKSGTQFEHYEIANEIKNIFIKQLPLISRALNWVE